MALLSNIRSVDEPPYPLLFAELCVFLALTEARGEGMAQIVCVLEKTAQRVFATPKRHVTFAPDPFGGGCRSLPHPRLSLSQTWAVLYSILVRRHNGRAAPSALEVIDDCGSRQQRRLPNPRRVRVSGTECPAYFWGTCATSLVRLGRAIKAQRPAAAIGSTSPHADAIARM